MRVLVIAENENERVKVREAVLEALQQDKGDCFMVSHEIGFGCCLRIYPDLIVVCDYDEALTPPTTHGVGFLSYNRIKEVVPEDHMIRMGKKYFRYSNYAQSLRALKALLYMQR